MIPRSFPARALAAVLVLAGCASARSAMEPGRADPASPVRDPGPPPAERWFSQEPAQAFQLQKMPLYTTGVPRFLRDNPESDGRGVLIGILDSGIDAGIPGLALTSTGDRKILDLRDFSGEGLITLAPVNPRHDTVLVGGVALGGFGRVILFNAAGPWYGGVIAEIALGSGPAADLDGNGSAGDTLAVIVTRASDGWILLADTDRDGSLAGEKPMRDYLVGRDVFTWSRTGKQGQVSVAANLSDSGGRPVLSLFFDTSGHGSHVAGIAAGCNLYDVPGFHGVAPGAQLLGLKIANNAQGGISTTGSMVRAIEYAIRFAARRRMPLVLNMSFAVGNEVEGQARIDHLVDSILGAHPELVLVLSAGNDGPGLSTLGFPASAQRALTVGAVLPGDPDEPAASRREPVAYYSGRGGEVAKPEVVAPGTAYSTVPLWDRGEEVKSGTSMAAPHVAGLVALLTSAQLADARPRPSARLIRHALMVTARPIPDASFADQGTGIPDVGAAWRWLRGGYADAEVDVRAESGVTASFRPAFTDSAQRFTLTRPAGLPPATFTLRSNVEWIVPPGSVTISDTAAIVTLRLRPGPGSPETHSGVVTGWPADTMAGPAFRLVTIRGHAVTSVGGIREPVAIPIAAGDERRLFIIADSGRPFVARARIGSRQPLLVFLHEPNGMPLRGAEPQIAGAGDEEVSFQVDGRDAVPGAYELVAVAPPTEPSSARFEVAAAPFAFDARREAAGVVARVKPAAGHHVRLGLVGGERVVHVAARGSDTVTVSFVVPEWATSLAADLAMARDQWSRFTDFGFSLFDSTGAILETAPLNYAFGRMEADFDAGQPARRMSLRLFAALAEPGSEESWLATLSIRLYAGRPVRLAAAPAGSSAPGDEELTVFPFPPFPWTLGEEFVPLGVLEIDQKGATWSREIPFPEPVAPLMR